MNVLEQIKQYGINTNSNIRAVQSITDLGFNDRAYREMMEDLTGQETDLDEFEVEFVFKYLVDNAITNGVIDLDLATKKGVEFLAMNPYLKTEREVRSYYVRKKETDAIGAPKRKKGAKKELAISLWKQNKKNLKVDDRPGWIEYLMAEVGMSKNGASTYFHNLKVGIYK